MAGKRVLNISDECNQYKTLQDAINDFIKFKTAQGMAELTLRDYRNTFRRFMEVSSNSMSKGSKKEV
jgi:hypothetical protein